MLRHCMFNVLSGSININFRESVNLVFRPLRSAKEEWLVCGKVSGLDLRRMGGELNGMGFKRLDTRSVLGG